ncbi:hypothetical protein [Marinifilum sp.]|uniref:hypothetical protein n=1 Tax=Marinifilum sp. TaxID=2033137 RepID=UPI003BAA8104
MKIKFFTISACLVLLFVACDKDDNNSVPQEDTRNFFFINSVDLSAYAGTFSDMSKPSIDNSDAYEYPFGIYPFVHGNTILLPEGTKGDIIHKLIRNNEGKITQSGSLSFEQGARPGEITFLDKNTAYASLNGRGKMAIFDPETLQKKGEIDLKETAAVDNNPDPGCNVIRKGKMFVALNQLQTVHTSVPGTGAEVAVIDLTSNTLEKVIKDDRTCVVGLFRHSDAIVDEKNDIYFYSQGIDGMNPLKDGFLRIKNNETQWDTDYYFKPSETKVSGLNESATYGLSFYYAGNGIAYSTLMLPSKSSYPPDYLSDKNFQAVKINLWDKTIEKIDLPLSTSMGAFGITEYNGKIVFGLVAEPGSGYYTYDPQTGDCSKTPITTVAGIPSDIIAFE